MFSDYLVKNFNFFQTFSEEDLVDAMAEFDCYLIDPDHKQIIQEINPPLPEEEFEEEFKSDKDNKKYYYSSLTANSKMAEDTV
jgi:hypothetical protein